MGIHDRDYMREDGKASLRGIILSFLACILLGIFALYLIFFSLRLPAPIYIKVPLLVGIGLFVRQVYRWTFTESSRSKLEGNSAQRGYQAERRGNHQAAATLYAQALKHSPSDPAIKVRLLAAYYATDQSAEAMKLIATFDGQAFPAKHVEELEFLVLQYQKASFTQADATYRVKLD